MQSYVPKFNALLQPNDPKSTPTFGIPNIPRPQYINEPSVMRQPIPYTPHPIFQPFMNDPRFARAFNRYSGKNALLRRPFF